MVFSPLLRTLAASALLLLLTPGWSAGEEEPSAPPSSASTPSSPSETTGAPAAGGMAEAQALVNAGRHAEALVILGPLVRGEEAGSDVLFLFGLAAVEASQQPGLEEENREALLDGAIAAFRQMLIEAPGLVRVHLELGRAFYLKGEDDLARRHFEAVLAGGVPQPVAANVSRFLAAMQARRRWSYNAGFALAPDTNIGAGSDERTIYIYGLPFQRDAEELTTSGVGVVVWGGAEYQYPMNDRTRLRSGANLYRREHGGSQFDEASLLLRLGPRVLIDARTEASVLATARQHWAGTVKDHHALGGRIEVGRRLTQRATAHGSISLEDRHYRTRTHLNGTSFDVSLAGAYVITPTVRADVSLGYGRDRPDQVRDRHERYRVGAGVSVILPAGFTVSGGGDYRWTDYEAGWFPHVPDNGAREDKTWSVRASVYNRAFTLMGFSPELGVVHEVRETNAQLYDYERTSGELRFVRQF